MTDRPEREARRLLAIDVVRGIAMVIMTLDHSSGSFNAGRLMGDSAATFDPATVLEPLQFMTRWVTHLCAPTFVLLSGASLALSVTRRRRDGIESSIIDREMLIRGALLIALDAVWMSWIWRWGIVVQLGVLYAIGVAMIGMIALRRFPATLVGALGLAVMVGGEAFTSLFDPGTPIAIATLTGGQIGPVHFLYAWLPWTGYMMLGWAIGMKLAGRDPRGTSRGDTAGARVPPTGPGMRARDWLVLAAIAAIAFLVFRGFNGYGNAQLVRRDTSWVEWLHVSKYPPSLAFDALELAVMFALLAAVWRWSRPWKPLVVLGQTALLYYLLHVHLLKGGAHVLGLYKTEGLGVTYLAWIAAMVILYPLCRWYLGIKRRHPDSALRFL